MNKIPTAQTIHAHPTTYIPKTTSINKSTTPPMIRPIPPNANPIPVAPNVITRANTVTTSENATHNKASHNGEPIIAINVTQPRERPFFSVPSMLSL